MTAITTKSAAAEQGTTLSSTRRIRWAWVAILAAALSAMMPLAAQADFTPAQRQQLEACWDKTTRAIPEKFPNDNFPRDAQTTAQYLTWLKDRAWADDLFWLKAHWDDWQNWVNKEQPKTKFKRISAVEDYCGPQAAELAVTAVLMANRNRGKELDEWLSGPSLLEKYSAIIHDVTRDVIKLSPIIIIVLSLALAPAIFLIWTIIKLSRPVKTSPDEANFGYYEYGDPDRFISITDTRLNAQRHGLIVCWIFLITYVLIPFTIGISIPIGIIVFYLFTGPLSRNTNFYDLSNKLRMRKLEQAAASARAKEQARKWAIFNRNRGVK